MLEESSGLRDSSLKEQLEKLMIRASLERMHAAVDMILMYMLMEVLVLISVEKNQLLLNLWKENQEDQE